MKVKVEIYGGISGNRVLTNAIKSDNITDKGARGYTITFSSKGAAKKALSDAYRHLIEDEPEYSHGISKGYKGESISYDASTAKIVEA